MTNFWLGLMLGANLMLWTAIHFKPDPVQITVTRMSTPIIPELPLPKAVH